MTILEKCSQLVSEHTRVFEAARYSRTEQNSKARAISMFPGNATIQSTAYVLEIHNMQSNRTCAIEANREENPVGCLE